MATIIGRGGYLVKGGEVVQFRSLYEVIDEPEELDATRTDGGLWLPQFVYKDVSGNFEIGAMDVVEYPSVFAPGTTLDIFFNHCNPVVSYGLLIGTRLDNIEEMRSRSVRFSFTGGVYDYLVNKPKLLAETPERWETSTVMGMVRRMLADNNFSALPILADALQDADYPDEETLAIMRSDATAGDWVTSGLAGSPTATAKWMVWKCRALVAAS